MNTVQPFSEERINKDNSKPETIRQLAKRHMMDQSHTTTDEELKNAVVESEPSIFNNIEKRNNFNKKSK